MLNWLPALKDRKAPAILCLGAHCDDIEIGCGGTLMQIAEACPGAVIRCVVFSSSREREDETRNALGEMLPAIKGLQIDVHQFRNSYFPYIGADIKELFETFKDECRPDLIFTHYRGDRHQDHRVISDLTWNSFRDHNILEYEIPKYDGDLSRPNTYVSLDQAVVERKVSILLNAFPSQAGRNWFTADTFKALLRLRGVECNSDSGFAEAFHARKQVLTF